MNDIVYMLRADGEAYGIIAYTDICQLLLCHLRMGCRSRVNDQTLHICHIGQQGEQAQGVDESERFFSPAFDIESKDRASALCEIAFVLFVAFVARYGWVVHFFNRRMRCQVLQNSACVATVAFHAQGERFYAL